MSKKAKPKKRLVRGRDWHGWCWKAGKTDPNPGQLEPYAWKWRPSYKNEPSGKWVKVKFIEVD